MENNLKSNKLLILVLSFQFIFFLSASATRDFHSRGEPREAIVVQNMMAQGELILPQGYAGVVPSKPPLFHWLTAALSIPSGHVSELSARMPSILAACLIALICFLLFAPESSKTVALFSVLVLGTSNEWLRTASAARVDMLLTAMLTTSFYALYRWSSLRYLGFPWLLTISVSLAILCKGPVGAVLPGLIYLAISLYDRVSIWQILKRGLLVFVPALLVASLWYIAAYLERPHEFLDKIYYENVARFLSMQEDEPHKTSALKLYGLLILGFIPWTLVLFAIFIKKLRSHQLKITIPNLIYLKIWWRTRARIDVFCMLVVALTLIFYSIPQGKRSAYLLPAHPFIAFWFARICLEESKLISSKVFIYAAYTVAFVSLLLLVLFSSFIVTPGFLLAAKFPASIGALILETQQSILEFLTNSFETIVMGIFCTGLLIGVAMTVILRTKQEEGLPWFLASIFTLCFWLQLLVVPSIVNPISVKVFAKQIVAVVPEQTQLLSYGEEFYGLSFYSGRKFLRSEQSGFPNGAVIVVAVDDLLRLKESLPAGVSLELLDWSSKSVMTSGKHLGLFKIVT